MIRLDEVGVRLKGNQILRDVSFDVGEGEAVAVVGESGAGKSTLGRVLLGLVPVSTGRYLFRGEEVATLRGVRRRSWRRACQAVFQDPLGSLDPRMTIAASVTEPVGVHDRLDRKARRELAEELLEQVGLDPSLAVRLPHQLSGGQRQRVVVARAISTRPSVLVLDEPVSALDVSARAQLLELLAELRRSTGMTLVYITHDLATVGYLCERVVVLYRGDVVEELRAEDLTSDAGPRHPYTRALLDSVVTVDKPLVDGAPIIRRGLVDTAACRFAHACPHAQERCVELPPEMTPLAAGGSSKCHFADAAQLPPAAV